MRITVDDVMTSQVVKATPNMTLEQLDELLVRHAISGVPVVHNGRLVGVVSHADVVRALLDEQTEPKRDSDFDLSPFPIPIPALTRLAERSDRIGEQLANLTVGDLMTTTPVTISPEAAIEDAAKLMVTERIHRVLVTRGGELVGVVTALDLVSTLAETAPVVS